MATHRDPPKPAPRPAQQSATQQPKPDPAAVKPQAERGPNAGPNSPLEPPLPPAQSAPDRQAPPEPNPEPDEAPRDQRLANGDPANVLQNDPGTLTPDQRVGTVTEPHIPGKFKRPLPQPGDNDYVAGGPVNEEEAQRMEQLEEDRYHYAVRRGEEVEARRRQLHPNAPDLKPGEPPRRPDRDFDDNEEKRERR